MNPISNWDSRDYFNIRQLDQEQPLPLGELYGTLKKNINQFTKKGKNNFQTNLAQGGAFNLAPPNNLVF